MSDAAEQSGEEIAELREPEPDLHRRLTEGLLAPVVNGRTTPPAILDLIAGDRRWGVRYPLRLSLVRNPSTPLKTAWRLLETLRRIDLKPVAADPRRCGSGRGSCWER